MNHEIISNLFLYFQSAYGNSFISQFSNGQTDQNGEDIGLKTAIGVWDDMLHVYSRQVVEAAAKAALRHYTDFPPNLPQFAAVCRSLAQRIEQPIVQANRITYEPQPVKRFLANSDKQHDGRDWAREIMAKHRSGATVAQFSLNSAMSVLGLQA